jgi:pre-mRNA-processing factor 19
MRCRARLELSAALYKQDAAERTIARLIRERDQAREQAREGGGRRGAAEEEDRGGVKAMELEEGALSAEQDHRITQTGEGLIAQRKTRTVPATTAKGKEVGLLKETQSHDVLPGSKKGLTAVARHGDGVLAVGAADGTIALWQGDKAAATLKGHSKAVSAVRFAAGDSALGSVLSASYDGAVRVWTAKSGLAYASAHTFSQLHAAEVTALSVHPCGSFFASASRDQSWAFVDLGAAASVYTVSSNGQTGAVSAASFHPDGFLLATATEDAKFHLRLWEVKSKENVISFPGHTGRINSISFSENGFYLATGSADRCVKMWDLRNLNSPVFASEQGEHAVAVVSFDHSGEFLAAGGQDVHLYHVKSPVPGPLEHLNRLVGHKAAVADLAWGPGARSVFTVSADKTLKVYA